MNAYNRIEGIKKIAILRANALGDFIFALPALHALRAAYPDAEMIYLGRAWHAGFLNGRPGPVNRVAVIPRWRGVGVGEDEEWQEPTPAELEERERFFAAMVDEHFDLALQMHGGGGHSNPFLHRLGARVTAGLRAPNAPPLDRWVPYYYWQHEVLRMLEVVGLVGAAPVMLEPRIEVTERDIAESCAALPETDKPIVVLHPGASSSRRRWPAEHFAAVGDTLAREGYRIVIAGIPSEREVVDQVQSAMQQPAHDLCGRVSLHGLTGLLHRASLVIGNDSGPRHLAEAAGTPTVGIYWCGNVINAGALYRAHHRPLLSWRLDCPVCGKNTVEEGCQHQETFVDKVSVEEVMSAARELLS